MDLFPTRSDRKALRCGLAAACAWLAVAGATLFAAERQTKTSSPGGVRASQQGGVQPGPTLSSLGGSPGSATQGSIAGMCGLISLTQSVAPNTIVHSNSVACDNAGNNCTFANAYARSFNLGVGPTAGQSHYVRRVVYGVQEALGTNPVTIALYQDTNGGPPNNANLVPLASLQDVIPNGTQLAVRTVNFTAMNVVVPANAFLVVTVESPDLCATAGVNNNYFNGSNSSGESAPSYIKAAGCELPDYVSLAAIGFPFQNMVMTVELEQVTGACCAGDFDCDNVVTNEDIPDFVTALLAGGPCPAPPACCPGDFNSDGMVDGSDIPGFLAKLFAGGACP